MPSEADFLRLQGARARARLRLSARTLADELLAPLQLRPFVRRRPWWSVGGATAAGFLTGMRLGRRGDRSATGSTKGRLHSGLASVGNGLRSLLRTAMGAMVMASLRGGTPGPSAAPTTKGNGPASAVEDSLS